MLRSVQAMIDEKGTVRLLESVQIRGVHHAIVTILEESPGNSVGNSSDRGARSASADLSMLRNTSGLWAGRNGDGLEYQRRLRSDWDG